MTRDELTDWLRSRGVDDKDLDEFVTEHLGKTEDEMDKIYDRHCGPMA